MPTEFSSKLPQSKLCIKCEQELPYTRQFCPYCQTKQPQKPITAFKACQSILNVLESIQADGLPLTTEMLEPIIERLAAKDSVFHKALHEFFSDHFDSINDI